MSTKPFVMNIGFASKEEMSQFFDEIFYDHPREVALYEADSLDAEVTQSVQQYVVRSVNVINERITKPISTAGGRFLVEIDNE